MDGKEMEQAEDKLIKVWTLMIGKPGYLPDRVDWYERKEDAIYEAMREKEYLQDNPLAKVRGNIRKDNVYHVFYRGYNTTNISIDWDFVTEEEWKEYQENDW